MGLNNSELGTPIHHRTYDVSVYRARRGVMRLRGAVRDDKPPHLHLVDDPDPLTIHHMVVDLEVDGATAEILDVDVVFESHPHQACPRIIDHYDELVGASLMGGYSRRVNELFGRRNGCTHTNALLLAMGPVFIQSVWSLRVLDDRETVVRVGADAPPNDDTRPPIWLGSVDTCHVWSSDGDFVKDLRAGGPLAPPQTFIERAAELGVPEEEWRAQFG